MNEFKKKLADLINEYSLEGDSDTPDWILADYLCSCLIGYNTATRMRNKFCEKEAVSAKMETLQRITKDIDNME